ncbi:MAG: segregation/condensation protein A [Synechococcus sp.]
MLAVSLAEEAIALLIELAERGEIDPWDVQVIDVIDRFLMKLAPTANTRDLSESGQAFLYASMLVYLKALALAEAELEEEEEDFDEAPFEGEIEPLPSIPLEQTLRPRPVARIQRTRPVTLKEIIAQFQVLEQAVQERAGKPRKVRNKAVKGERITSISQLSHPENLAETVSLLEPILANAWQTAASLTFEALVALQEELYPGKASLATVFWALLMMASRSQVRLHQEEFYMDLAVSAVFPAEESPPARQTA